MRYEGALAAGGLGEIPLSRFLLPFSGDLEVE